MLRALNITDFVIVDRAELEFGAGFTALTGETGAGKSILIDALALVLGERADASVVRQGAEKAEISAEFDIAHATLLKRWLADNDLAGDDDGFYEDEDEELTDEELDALVEQTKWFNEHGGRGH